MSLPEITNMTTQGMPQRSYSDLICFISVIYFLPQPEQTISLPSAFLIFSLYKVVGVIFIHVWYLSVKTSLMFQWRRLNRQYSTDWPLTNIWVLALLFEKVLTMPTAGTLKITFKGDTHTFTYWAGTLKMDHIIMYPFYMINNTVLTRGNSSKCFLQVWI